MKCTYYYHNKERNFRNHFCIKKESPVKGSCYHQYCKSENYETCPIYKLNKERNCLFTTILQEKLNLSDAKDILNTLNLFRKNILEKEPKYRELLVIHDRISPIISDAIRNTNINTINEFLTIIYKYYIIPINKHIIDKNYNKALTKYKKMIELLVVNFSLGQDFARINYHYKYPENYLIKLKKTKNII